MLIPSLQYSHGRGDDPAGTTIETLAAVDYPTADQLDTGDWSPTSGAQMALYLIPAEESNSGRPEVTAFQRLGAGTPMPAWHRRWAYLCTYGAQTVGASVLEALRAAEERLLDLSASYLGAEWTGSNHVGRWRHEDLDVELDLDDHLRHYWDAGDYYADQDWAELAREAGVDPERALGTDWEAVAAEVAQLVEARTTEAVSGTAGYLRELAERYREEQAEIDDDE